VKITDQKARTLYQLLPKTTQLLRKNAKNGEKNHTRPNFGKNSHFFTKLQANLGGLWGKHK
jgi:hypothetical protein